MIERIEILKNEIGSLVKKRIKEFEENGKSDKKIFLELCFCILTANFNAKKAIEIQEKIGDKFLSLDEKELEKELKKLGHRFPKTRARYIIKARKYKDLLKKIIENFKDEKMLREWLANNIKGVGYKEASHFLRNIGFKNLAIIDFHILEFLEKNKIIKRPKSLSKKKYLEIENILSEIGKKLNLNLAELDLYLWYMETGKILK